MEDLCTEQETAAWEEVYLIAGASYKEKPQTPYCCFSIASHSRLVKTLHAHPDAANYCSPAEKGMVTCMLWNHLMVANSSLLYVAQHPFQTFHNYFP